MRKFIASVISLCMIISCTAFTFAAEIGEEIIVGAEGFVKIDGTWNSSDNASGIHYNNKGIYSSEEGTAKISAVLPESGCYELFWYYSGHTADAAICSLSFSCMDGHQNRNIDVSKGKGWVSIGKYNYDAGITDISISTVGQTRFSGVMWRYAGVSISVLSKVYTVNSASLCITDIPYGTDADEFLDNVIPIDGMTLDVTDTYGNTKIGILQDGDRLRAEYDGEVYDYYLKTTADGIYYSDNFNYKNYEEYKTLQNALNKTNRANEFMSEEHLTPQIIEYNGNKAIAFEPKKKEIPQIPNMNFIKFNEISDKAIVEYDVTQINMPTGSAWIDVGAEYTGAVKRADGRGYALWSGNLHGRGTLMRNSSYGARWLSLDRNKLKMESKKTYHVRQMLDFNGDIETYIDGVKADVTNEQVTENVSKSMAGFKSINGLGIGVYTEKLNWANLNVDARVVFDNIKVYNPIEYIEYLIDRLPEEGLTAGQEIIVNVDMARKALTEAVEIGLNENEISNLKKLTYWENQIKQIGISSDIYTIDNDTNTISGVIKGQTMEEMISYLSFNSEAEYSIAGKNEQSVIESGDILTVINAFGERSEYEIIADRDIAVLEYTFEQDSISDVPYGTDAVSFLRNIVYPKSAEAAIYTGENKNNGTVIDGDVLKINLDGIEKIYSISVTPMSGDNYILSAGEYTVSENTISGIPYNKLFSELKSVITVSKFAEVVYPYADDYDGAVSDGDTIIVKAQNGDERVYTLLVNSGNSTSELSGKEGVRVDSVNKVISGMDKGISVEKLLSLLTASNGGTVKLYSKDQSEIKAGEINGTETVRVFFEDPKPGNICDIYTLSPNPQKILGDEIIVTIDDEGFSCTGEKIFSGAAVELGYNGITTVYINGGNAIFRPQIQEDGDYEVYVYTSYHSSNKECPAVITYNGGTAEAVIPQNQPSGWKLLGTYSFAKGNEGFISCGNTVGGGFGRYSAVKFQKCGELVEITDVKALTDDNSFELNEGLNQINNKNVKLELCSNAVINKSDITITSENGNESEFALDFENGVYTITPKSSFKDNITYYINVDSEAVSKPYTYVLKGKESLLEANVKVIYSKENGVIVSSAGEADCAQVKLNIANTADKDITAKLLVCYYPEAGVMESCTEENITIQSGRDLKISKQIDIENSTSQGKVKVFIWQEDFTPITGIYYN